MLGRRHDEDALARHKLRDPVHRVLQKAPIPEEVQELLRSVATRKWPEACSGATGKHEDVKPWHGLLRLEAEVVEVHRGPHFVKRLASFLACSRAALLDDPVHAFRGCRVLGATLADRPEELFE